MLALMIMVTVLGGPHPQTSLDAPALMPADACYRRIEVLNKPGLGSGFFKGQPIVQRYYDCVLVDGQSIRDALAKIEE